MIITIVLVLITMVSTYVTKTHTHTHIYIYTLPWKLLDHSDDVICNSMELYIHYTGINNITIASGSGDYLISNNVV